MDVGSTQNTQALNLFTSQSGDVDGEALMLTISLTNGDNAAKIAQGQQEAIASAIDFLRQVSQVADGFSGNYGDSASAGPGLANRVKTAADFIRSDLANEISAQQGLDPGDRNPAETQRLQRIVDNLESGNIDDEAGDALKGKDATLDADGVRALSNDMGIVGFSGDFTSGFSNLNSSVAATLASASARLEALSEQTKVVGETLLSTVGQSVDLIAGLRSQGKKFVEALTTEGAVSASNVNGISNRGAEQTDAQQVLEEALLKYQQLQVPDGAASIVTGQLTEAQQQQVGRSVEEFLRDLRHEMESASSSQTGGNRALEQQSKRIRV